jgi:hypothetical protein
MSPEKPYRVIADGQPDTNSSHDSIKKRITGVFREILSEYVLR